jgi:ferric-dicitrate binding protein FerR (iron transport regulator)
MEDKHGFDGTEDRPGDSFGHGSDEDDMVGRLVRLAAPGPQIPEDGADRVKSSLRPEWNHFVKTRQRQRTLMWAGAGLAATASVILGLVLLIGGGPNGASTAHPVARLAVVIGSVEIVPPAGAAWHGRPDDTGVDVVPGSWLRTDEAARAALDLGAGRSLRLDTGTRVRLESSRTMTLDHGAVYIDSADSTGGGLEVRTSLGVAREIGTQFEVRRTGDVLSVSVREGSVALARDGDRLEITHGNTVRVSPDGSVERGVTQPHGPSWAWTLEVAPPLEIEGRTLVAFLDWVSRETGLWVRFSDREVERLAGTTILHGSVKGLDPRQAAEVVLPSCGLDVRVETDTLVIGPLEARGGGS